VHILKFKWIISPKNEHFETSSYMFYLFIYFGLLKCFDFCTKIWTKQPCCRWTSVSCLLLMVFDTCWSG